VPTVGAPVSDGYDGPPRVVAYIRVSHERVGMVSPELQLAAIDEVCQRFGYALVSVISDLDRSGLFWKRRQVEQAVEMIEAGGADILMVWKWSRIARNRRDWAIAVDRIESAGGRLESATEPVDASTSSGRLAMLAEFAAFEADRVGDMWREAHNRRIRHGLPPSGRPHYGYRYVDKGYLPDPVTGPALARPIGVTTEATPAQKSHAGCCAGKCLPGIGNGPGPGRASYTSWTTALPPG
jgi:site-specific DNA recombinase